MNPDHAPRHTDYPPIIEQYRGPLVPPPLPGRTQVVRLSAADFAAPIVPRAATPAPSPNAGRVTFWSWLGLMGSLATSSFFLWRIDTSTDTFMGSPAALRYELLAYLACLIACLVMIGWSIRSRKLAYNPRRLLKVGLSVSAFDLLIVLFIIYLIVTLPSFRCAMGAYQGCMPIY